MLLKIVIGLAIGGGAGALMGYYGKCTSGTCPLTSTPWRGAMYGAAIGLMMALSYVKR